MIYLEQVIGGILYWADENGLRLPAMMGGAKESGLGVTTFTIEDSGGTARAVINDVTALTINTPSAIQDITGIDKSAMERLFLLADGSFNYTYVFNDAATTGIFTVLKAYRTLNGTDVGRTHTFVHSAQTLAMDCLLTDFPLVRGADGSFGGSATAQLSSGTVPAWS